jgi:hypothetical protein
MPPGHNPYRVLPHVKGGPPHPQLPIRSVRLGPLLPDGHLDTVKALLERNELNAIPVQLSEVPLR